MIFVHLRAAGRLCAGLAEWNPSLRGWIHVLDDEASDDEVSAICCTAWNAIYLTSLSSLSGRMLAQTHWVRSVLSYWMKNVKHGF